MGAVRSAECERARLWVSVGIDGELSELERASLRSHVGGCAACAEFQQEAAALTRELRAAPRFPVSIAAGAGSGSTAVVELSRRRRTTVRALQACAAAAAVAVAAGLGSLVGTVSSPGSPTTATSAKTGGGNRGAVIDRGIVAMAPGDKLPASRIRPSVPV
jgi:anti-sigma factor RsiW